MDRALQSGDVDLISTSRHIDAYAFAARSRDELLQRNDAFETFFERESPRLPQARHKMSRCFRQVAGSWPSGTAPLPQTWSTSRWSSCSRSSWANVPCPALDLGPGFEANLPVLVRLEDMVMGSCSRSGGG